MDFLDKALQDYIALHTAPEPPVLKRLSRETYAKVLMPRMLSGHVQGRLLAMLSHMIRPAAILEIGTFTGYSAICLAEGLRENGKLYTIDINEELEDMVRNFFKEAGVESKIDYRIGNALQVIPTLDVSFDMVFIDADKMNYINYYNDIFAKVNKGGFIIADNVLWGGKVVGEPGKKTDEDTQAIIDFNRQIQQDERVENVLLPVRDGLMIVRKK
jgi:predicted O-methyltransferase YrrM